MMFTQPFQSVSDTNMPQLELVDFALSRIKDAIYIVNGEERFCYVNASACQMLHYGSRALLQLRVTDIDPDWTGRTQSDSWWKAYKSDSGVTFETRHVTRFGMIVPVEVNLTRFKHKGRSYCMCVVRDIRERKHIEQLAYAREQEFRALVENTPDLITRFDPQLKCLYANSATLVHLGLALEQLLGRQFTESMPGARCAMHIQQLLQQVVDTRSSAEGELAEENGKGDQRHLSIHHIRCVPEFDRHGALVSILAVGRDITAIRYAEKKLADSHMQLRLLARQREISREAERKHISREIHDELGQHLTTIRMSLSLMRMCHARDNPDLQAQLKKLMQLSDQTIQVVRNVSTSLRPNVLNMGLTPALEWLCDEFNRNYSGGCVLKTAQPELTLKDESATAAFRVAQESLTNVARHAQATRVVITLESQSGNVVLRIRDNGKGFNTGIDKADTFGLISMKERGSMLGGEVVIDSAPGRGTLVQLTFPNDTDRR
ncbi:PAS domain-containing protein [Brenneria sp. g21c3]|uniref:PAS domain-containing sensor histidine kinase n=1 Tax=Brenneria sp. g21c3 TaxID=3093893 RepID=UPI002EA199C2|nr:PAS domain-containing protein [Brenneria sp. g21c3]